jgi:hypothetical protein
MQTEEEEVFATTGNSPTGSQTSSFDGVFPEPDTRSSHPFRIIEHDALSLHSLTSLGRLSRILSTGAEIGWALNIYSENYYSIRKTYDAFLN